MIRFGFGALQSDALENVAEIVSTGLNLERSKARTGSRLDVVCNGGPDGGAR